MRKLSSDSLRARLRAATVDPDAQAARESLATCLAGALEKLGSFLWLQGAFIGGDRATGTSPFDFGSDATVGIAVVVQIAGELMSGANTLLRQDSAYAAAALIRQLVEVEYLAWAFGSDEAEAERWMRSTKEQRMRMWQPRHLRDRSGGRFRGTDYAMHCERGGHPTPHAIHLLPDHSARQPIGGWWFDLCSHGMSTWSYASEAVNGLGHSETLEKSGVAGVAQANSAWQAADARLFAALAEIRVAQP